MPGQDVQCVDCVECEAGTYLSAGCTEGKPKVCANCSACGTGYPLFDCTTRSDTVCEEVASCRLNASFVLHDWLLLGDFQCLPGLYLSGVAGDGVKQCARCPGHLVGLNGYWCEPCVRCKGPYDRTECVCHGVTVANSAGECECGFGCESVGTECVACGEDVFDKATLALGGSWCDQRKAWRVSLGCT